jgi:hypothetical protein
MGLGPTGRPRFRLLYVGDATLARECLGRPGGSIDVLEAATLSAGIFSAIPADRSLPFDVLLIEHGHPGVDPLAILGDLSSRKLHVPVVIVAEWDEALAVAALRLGASDYVARSRASFRAVYFRLHRLIAHASLLTELSKLRDANREQVDAKEHNREDLTRRLKEQQAAREDAERRLNAAIAAVKQARENRFADAVTAARELAHRESGFAAKLQALETTTRNLEQRLADRDAALVEAEARAATHNATWETRDRRQSELETALASEAERRRGLESKLEQADAVRRAAEQQRLAEAAAFGDRLAQHHAEAAAAAAQMARQRNAVEQQLRDALADIKQVRHDRAAEAEASAHHVAQRESELLSELRSVTEARDRFERRLIDAQTALRCAEQRVTAEHHAGQQRVAEQQAEFQAELSRQSGVRDALRHQLADKQRALQDAEERRSAEQLLAATRLADREAEHAAQLADAVAVQDALQSQLASVEAALQNATERQAKERNEAATRLADQAAEHAARLAEAAAGQDALRSQLALVEAALQNATERLAEERNEAATRLADREGEHAVRLADAAAVQNALRNQLASVEAGLREANERHAAEINDVSARLAHQQAEYTALISETAALQDGLRSEVASVEARLEDAHERHAVEMNEATARFTESRVEADARLAQAAAAIVVIESKLAESETARQRAESKLADTATALERVEQQAAIDRQTAIAAGLQRQAEFKNQLAEGEAKRLVLAEQVRIAEATLQDARDRHALKTREAAARFGEAQEKSEIRLAQADTAIKVAESKRTEALAALDRVVRQATAERQAASQDSRQRQANFEASLRQEMERRQSVEKDLSHTRMAAEEARLQFVHDLAATTERGVENQARLEAQAAEDRAAWERVRVTADEEIRHLQSEGDRLHQSLVAAVQQIRRLETAQLEERSESERTRLTFEADFARQREEAAALQRLLNETRTTARETLERVSTDAARERSRLETAIADRERELQEQVSRAQSSDEAAAAALVEVEHRLNLSLAAQDRDRDAITQLQIRLDAVGEELEATRNQREAFKTKAGRVPVLQEEIDTIRAITRREFENTRVNRFRCSRSGTIIEVNGALSGMLGYDTPGDLQALDFRDAVFESGDELQWLINRSAVSHVGESIDTTWKKKDGRRIIVRLVAVATGADWIELVAEDITPLHDLEERLRNAQRMEAVARYGSEVAVTCQSLLTHVKQEGQLLLARLDSDVARYQGQLLLDDVARAAGFLGQLAAYGEDQRNAPDVVDVNKVLRDLAPVLKRVAGDNIDVVLPKTMTPLTLDVEARPVERMLVNVAAYGRERMPLGGRLMIAVDSVVVDRDFVAKYPNVRPGAHVLLTVNEVRSAERPELGAAVFGHSSDGARTAGTPGVDLGTLQALVSDCGGHLWMKAEPPGDMVLKIHLPRRPLERSDPPAMQRVRSGWLQRAFGSRH